MTTIYIAKNLFDIQAHMGPLPVFEDIFTKSSWEEYPDCWLTLIPEMKLVCKTLDALRCAPKDSTVIRIGRSVRESDKGALIETIMTHTECIWFYTNTMPTMQD